MASCPDFVKRYLSEASLLVQKHCVKEPTFSRGTYHIEIQESPKKKGFAFLQMKDDGELTDSFCSCKESEGGGGCVHLAAAYLRIFNGTNEPLHIRFKKSFWNRLFQMEAKRNGTESHFLQKEKNGAFVAYSQTKKELFSLFPKTPSAKRRCEEWIVKRKAETEETSIKFSNLSQEELDAYRKGQAGHLLRYELSFWADIAKWFLFLQDEKIAYQATFLGDPIPDTIFISFPDVELKCFVSEVQLPWLIASLSTIDSPLEVMDYEQASIESVVYDEEKRKLFFRHRERDKEVPSIEQGVRIGDWIYVKGRGFYRQGSSPLLHRQEVDEREMGEFLSTFSQELFSFLPIHREGVKARYFLHLDTGGAFHVEFYLFEKGDMQQEKAALFVPWVYLPKKGFFLVEDWMFESREKVIAREDVADFVNRHRIWLHQFPGFQTHLGSLESRLIYGLQNNEELFFDIELTFPIEDIWNFDEWIYVRGQGFYMKKESSGRLPLHPGLRVPKQEISSFIDSHKEELEQVHQFFNEQSPIEKIGLIVRLNEEGLIVITPKIEYAPNMDQEKIHSFGSYFYLEGKGFSPITPAMNVPEKYRVETVINASQENAFLSYELDALKPYILDLDPKMQRPSHLKLKIRRIIPDIKKRPGQWLVDLVYESEFGFSDIFSIWDAQGQRKTSLFSGAGLLLVREPRFQWIAQLEKRRLDRKKGLIRLTTLEWARLSAFERIEEPKGEDTTSLQARHLLQEMSRFETDRVLDLSGLKSTLRPYQEQGVNWLWFLYCHGLSGLLCDDMGLGKTHQAMALLAGVVNGDVEKRNKYLVVCPTSVIYHWEELLKKFLPQIRVCTYYGLLRSIEEFDAKYDLLLTSYGILRLGKEDLDPLAFEVAIFDEIQVAKNEASQTHQALCSLNAKMKLGLTGTPIENRVREIKSLFDVILPSYMPSDAVFRELFIRPIEKENDEEKKLLLTRLIKPFILRRKKSEVLLDLPEKIEEIAYTDLSEEQRKLYNGVIAQMRETVYPDLKDASKPVPYLHVFAALSKMKQICDHPALIDGDLKNFQKRASGKWDLFVELLQEARESGQKVVVFSQYLDMLALIEMYLKKKGIGYASIKGSTRDRSEQIHKFREDPKCEVFVASLLAAGVGIDLTVASIVIHYDRWWNPAKENQATDRVHRIGQSRGVQVFKLVAKNTIEEDIHELIERKKGLLEQIVGTDDHIQYLNREELIQIFEKMFRGQ